MISQNNLSTHVPFLMKLLKDVLSQNQGAEKEDVGSRNRDPKPRRDKGRNSLGTG